MEENKNLNEQLPEEPIHEAETEPAPEATPEPEAAPAPKKKKGKTLWIILGAVALVIVGLVLFFVLKGNKDVTRGGFINEIGGTSETFEGAVSEYAYSSAEEAAISYAQDEILGSYVYIDTAVNLGEVSASEHNIPEQFLEGSDRVEKLEVEYELPTAASLNGGAQAMSYSEGGEKARITVYVIKFGNEWRYFAPMPENGEQVNASYYESIFSSEKYQNCTLEIERTNKTGIFGFSLSESKIKWIIKLQDNKLYFEQTISGGGFIKEPDSVTAWYLEDTGSGNIKLYEKIEDGEWTYKPGYTLAFYNGLYTIYEIDEYTPFFDQLHFDHTLFTKTNYGFEVAEDNREEYFLDTYLWKELNRTFRQEGVYVYDEDVTVKEMYAEFFVQDGALTGVRMNSDFDFVAESEGVEITTNFSSEYVAKITNYGSTVIDVEVN